MIGLCVPLKKTNDVRLFLLEKGFLDNDYKIKTQDGFAFLGLTDDFNANVLVSLQKKFSSKIDIVVCDLEKVEHSPRSLSEYLEGKLSEDEIENLKKSFDIIGDVVILEIPESLRGHKRVIGEAALKITKRRSVFMKDSAVEGVVRTRRLEFLAGVDDSVTVHREHGARLFLDVRGVYFSPRLASERKRIVDQVVDGEFILDMFAGVGPFPILIARECVVDIIAIDINECAVHYMKESIERNKLKGRITPILGDSDEYLRNNSLQVDRVIMNLPGLAYKFLDQAIAALKPNGILHYYEFYKDATRAIERIHEAAKNRNVTILNTRKVKSTKPGEWHIVVDAKIN